MFHTAARGPRTAAGPGAAPARIDYDRQIAVRFEQIRAEHKDLGYADLLRELDVARAPDARPSFDPTGVDYYKDIRKSLAAHGRGTGDLQAHRDRRRGPRVALHHGQRIRGDLPARPAGAGHDRFDPARDAPVVRRHPDADRDRESSRRRSGSCSRRRTNGCRPRSPTAVSARRSGVAEERRGRRPLHHRRAQPGRRGDQRTRAVWARTATTDLCADKQAADTGDAEATGLLVKSAFGQDRKAREVLKAIVAAEPAGVSRCTAVPRRRASSTGRSSSRAATTRRARRCAVTSA